jgi:hypothetical protein
MMRIKILIPFVLFIFGAVNYSATAQLMVSVAGNGACDSTGTGGPAALAALCGTWGLAIDSTGKVYIGEYGYNEIMEISSAGIISKFAGNGRAWPWNGGDGGPADTAVIANPYYITLDKAGNMWVNEGSYWVREITAAGIVRTVAGDTSYSTAYNGDGTPATAQSLYTMAGFGLATDHAGNLYLGVCGAIRKVNAITGIMTTFANISPYYMVFDDSDNMYANQGYEIRKINSSGTISSYAGGGADTSDGATILTASINPGDLAFSPAGELYFVDGGYKIRKFSKTGLLTTVAGTGGVGFSGDTVVATAALTGGINNLAFDPAGNLYFNDELNHRIWKVILAPEKVPGMAIKHNITISPNPGSGFYYLSSDGSVSNGRLTVTNILGQAVIQQPISSSPLQFNLSAQPGGVYFAYITDEHGSVMKIEQFVKE